MRKQSILVLWLFLFGIIFVFGACSEQVSVVKQVDLKYMSGKVYHDRKLFEGLAVGPKIGYAFKVKENYQNGLLAGERVERFPNGLIKSHEYYERGQRHGVSKLWDKNGKLQKITNYNSGVINGKQILFSVLGFPSKISNFENGNKEGLEYSYLPKPNNGFFLSSITEYTKGNKNGAQTYYFHDGNYAKEIYFTNDYRVSGQCTWDMVGELVVDN